MRIILCIFGILALNGPVRASVTVEELNSTNIQTSGIIVNTQDWEIGGNRVSGGKQFRVIVTPRAMQKFTWEGWLNIKNGEQRIASCRVEGRRSSTSSTNAGDKMFEFEVSLDYLATSEFTLTCVPVDGSAFCWQLRLKDFVTEPNPADRAASHPSSLKAKTAVEVASNPLQSYVSNANNWHSAVVDLVVTGSFTLSKKSEIERISTKQLVYKSESLGDCSINLILDPHTQKTYIVPGHQTFYAPYNSDMFGFQCDMGGLAWRSSFVSVPGIIGTEDKAISKFVSEFDENRLFQERREFSYLSLARAAPNAFFTAGSRGGSQPGVQKITSIDLTGDILRLDLLSEGGRFSGSFWVDLKRKEIVKSVIDGQEIDMSTRPRKPK